MTVEPIIVSYSELDTFRQCPLKHAIGYGHRYTKPAASPALQKGSLWHLVLETHYKKIMEWENDNGRIKTAKREIEVLRLCREAVQPLLFEPGTGYQSEIQNLIEWMYEGHVEMWGADLQWKILAVEHQIITPLRDHNGRRTRYHLKAKMDLLVRDANGKIWVVDHKSGANLPTQMDLEIDDQFGLYTWAMREVGRPVVGAIHSANRTQRNQSPMTLESRLSRTYLNRTDLELTNIGIDAWRVARAAHPPKSEARVPYSSPDPRQCGWKCDFKEPHLLMRQGRKMHDVLTEYGFRIDRTRH